MRTVPGIPAAAPPSPYMAEPPHSTWHSPVPYLFGGLAAMMGLIALALLILACSYLKLTGYLDGGDETDGDDTLDAGDPPSKPAAVERFVVIMAGDKKPTFLATPTSSRAADAGDKTDENSGGGCESSGRVGEGKAREGGVSVPGGDVIQDVGGIYRDEPVSQNQDI